jgi:hypothetical protein
LARREGREPGFDAILIDAKRRVIANILNSEFTVLDACSRASPPATTARATTPQSACVQRSGCSSCIFRSTGPTSLRRGRAAKDRAIIEDALAKARADWFGRTSTS